MPTIAKQTRLDGEWNRLSCVNNMKSKNYHTACLFYFGNCVVCPSSIYGFWLPFWYLQTLLIEVPVPRQESEQSCICVLSVSIFRWSTIHICIFINCKSCILLKKTLRITHEPSWKYERVLLMPTIAIQTRLDGGMESLELCQ
jgi:hypothetical protein